MKNLLILLSLILSVIVTGNTEAGGGTPAGIEMTTAQSAPMKSCNNKESYRYISDCFTKHEEANHGFTILNRDGQNRPVKTEYVALLIHGLSDSPYFYRDISQILFSRGINVIAIRTTGHGSQASDLRNVSRDDWYKDLEYGKKLAFKHGKKLLWGGMSLGGGLVVHNALSTETKVHGMMLFSPAIASPFRYNLLCLHKNGYQAEKTYGVGVRYQKISNNGTCELTKINGEIAKLSKVDRRSQAFAHLDFPVLNVMSEYDSAIDLKKSFLFTKNNQSNKRNKARNIVYLNSSDKKGFSDYYSNVTSEVPVDEMKHASVLLKDENLFTPEGNPFFDVVEEGLNLFVNDLE